ncbi:unnamed protein product [Closterium sp. NIES-54]
MFLVYVDDILLFSESSAMIERVEEMLEMQFKFSKMGDVKYYLGMHVERDLDKGVLRLDQRKYCEGLAEKYGLQDGGKPATPLPSGFTVEPCADEEVVGESDRKLFHSMVGALNYAANHTRPDIAFATCRLASVISCPSHEQLEAAKRLVRYVSATASVGLKYSAMRQRQQWGAADLGKGEMLLTCYSDASFNSVKAEGTSIGGYVCLFGGGVVSWRSKKQNEVGLSSCETEYMALHHGAKEVVWLRRLLEEIGVFAAAVVQGLDGVLLGAGWKKSQVDEALYFKAGDNGVTFWGGRVPKTPVSVDAYAELTFDDEKAQERKEEEYRQKVGSLQFAAMTTWPDISFACSKLGSGLTVRSDQHWCKVDHCLAYLADTHDTALEFSSGLESLELIGYVDADVAGDKQNRTSTGGYVFAYEGATISWSSSRIKCTTLSSTESDRQTSRRMRYIFWLSTGALSPSAKFVWSTSKTATMMCSSTCRALLHGWCGDGVLCVGCTLRTSFLRGVLPCGLEAQAWARSGVLASSLLGQRRRLSSRLFTVGELLDRLRQAAGDRCGVAVDRGARQLQLTGLGDGWAIDQEGQFDQEIDGAVR